MDGRFDAIVVGAGQAGPALAVRLAGAGMRVALIERHRVGGTCVNTGCTPTKTLIASAKVAHQARGAAQFGVQIGGGVTVDWPVARGRKNSVVEHFRGGLEQWLRSTPNLTLIAAHARFVSPTEIAAGAELLSAPRVFLNVGGRARIPEFPGVRSVPYLTNTSILDLEQLPQHLLIVGGSYIGLEFAQAFRRFGCEVTLIEKARRLIAREDEDVSLAVEQILSAEGIAMRLGAECIRFRLEKGRVIAGVDCETGAPEVTGSHVLLAVGRRPNTDDLGVAQAGLELDADGFVQVDEELCTNVPGIWALGDCNGRGAFTHTAYNDYEIVADNLLSQGRRRVTDRIACYGLFIDPPLGRAGLTEREARAQGRALRISTRPMTQVSRAVEKGESQGFMKVIVDAESERILGAAILGVGGDEAVHTVIDTMSAGEPYQTLRNTMHIHPTVAELIPTLLGELPETDSTAASSRAAGS